jgi:hypothetical protein
MNIFMSLQPVLCTVRIHVYEVFCDKAHWLILKYKMGLNFFIIKS